MSHNCQHVTQVVTDYIEGRMTLGQRLKFRLSLAICPACQTYVDQMQQTVKVMGKMPAEPIPEDVHDALCNAFKDWKKPK